MKLFKLLVHISLLLHKVAKSTIEIFLFIYLRMSMYERIYFQMKKLLWKSGRDLTTSCITRKIDNEVDYQDGVLRVSATQFHVDLFPQCIDQNTTAGDVILR